MQDLDNFIEKINTCSFRAFLEGPFCQGFESIEGRKFITWNEDSEYSFVRELAQRLVRETRTITIGPRNFSKTWILSAYYLWRMTQANHDIEIIHMMHKQKSAEKKVQKIIRVIEGSPLLKLWFNFKSGAKTKILAENRNGALCSLEPEGIKSFKRGLHCDILGVDDPFKDEQSAKFKSGVATPTDIQKVSDRFFSEVTAIPRTDPKAKSQSELHVIGTAIHKKDFMHELLDADGWDGVKRPAILEIEYSDDGKKIIGGQSAWPAFYPDLDAFNEKLRDSNSMRVFEREHLGIVEDSTNSFLDLDDLKECFGFHLRDRPTDGSIVGGHDIGKKLHPSCATLFIIGEDGHMWELETEWMDGKNYSYQIGYWKDKFQTLQVDLAFFDNTRGEFEHAYENDLLPALFRPYSLNNPRARYIIAAVLEKRVGNQTIHFKANDKNYRQLAGVNVNLKAPETSEGHSDNFWATAMACYAASKIESVKKEIIVPSSSETLSRPSRWKMGGSR